MIAPLYSPDTFWEMRSEVAQRAARRYVPVQEAAEIAQEALYHFCRALSRGCSLPYNDAYLCRIVQRCAIDYGRARRRRPVQTEIREEDIPLRAGRGADSSNQTLVTQQRLDLDTLMTQLPPRERSAVRAVRAGEFVERLAQGQGVSVRTVQRRVQRAICRMRAIVRERENSDLVGT